MVLTRLGTVRNFHLKYENGDSRTFLVDGIDTTTGNLETGIPWVKAFVCIMMLEWSQTGTLVNRTMSNMMNRYETTFINEFKYCNSIKTSVVVAR